MKEYEEMTEEGVESALLEVLMYGASVDDTTLADCRVKTFSEEGVLTMNNGLVIQMPDGSEFQLTIIQSR